MDNEDNRSTKQNSLLIPEDVNLLNSFRTGGSKEYTNSWQSDRIYANGKRKFSRSRSLAHLAVDSYTPGEIRRIRERLLRYVSK